MQHAIMRDLLLDAYRFHAVGDLSIDVDPDQDAAAAAAAVAAVVADASPRFRERGAHSFDVVDVVDLVDV